VFAAFKIIFASTPISGAPNPSRALESTALAEVIETRMNIP